MSAHTKGPWSFSFEAGGITGPTCPRFEGPCVGGRLQKYTIVTVPVIFGCHAVLAICPEQEGAPGSADANARLITAAPELLAALKAMLPESNTGDNHCRPSFETCERARAAIAKAEGA